MLLSERFAAELGEPAVDANILNEVPENSECGRECRETIQIGSLLISKLRMAGNTEHVDDIISSVEQACIIYIRG
jgi:hypothetical protein